MQTARLNVFQKTQRLWDAIHPYNAGQVAYLVGDYPVEQVEGAFKTAFTDLGLGRFDVVGDRYTLTPAPAPAVQIVDNLDEHLIDGMNRPFDPASTVAVRPFVRPPVGTSADASRSSERNDGDLVAIGLIYSHWIADSVAIRMLMRRWVERLIDVASSQSRLEQTSEIDKSRHGVGARATSGRVVLDRLGLVGRFGANAAGWAWVSHAVETMEFASKMKMMRRLPRVDVDLRVGIVRRTLPTRVDTLHAAARRAGVTVGDVLLAATVDACAAVGPLKVNPRRPKIAVGSIVDLRAHAKHLPPNVFTLLLGFAISTFDPPEKMSFDELLTRCRSQRLTHNRRQSAAASQLRMSLGLLIGRRMTSARLLEFYRKRFPLAGGLSNVNMTSTWADLHPSPVVRYDRISPTGPLMPIVITPTSLGRDMHVCCTYRTAYLSVQQANAIVSRFAETLLTFVQSSCSEHC